MKLIASPTSPFVRKVRVLLHETGKTDAIEQVMVATTPLASDSQAVSANPIGKIPALVRDSGPAIYDSRVITQFLNATWDLGMYPAAREWEIKTLESQADAILDAAVTVVYEQKLRPEELHYETWFDAQRQKIDRAVADIESRWMSHLAGPLDMSHIAVGVALSYLDFRMPDRDWRANAPALADWHAKFAARQSMIDTVPPQ